MDRDAGRARPGVPGLRRPAPCHPERSEGPRRRRWRFLAPSE
jgi:hypothetical protein